MPSVRSFKDLHAWTSAMQLAESCYRVSEQFPAGERFGLTAQLRGAAVSVPSNIAEGQRQSSAAFLRHLRIALGSHAEVETQMLLARRLGYLRDADWNAIEPQLIRVGELLHGLLRAVRQREADIRAK